MPKGKPVINLITEQYFNSAYEAGKILGIDNSDIGKACKAWGGVKNCGKLRSSVGRYKWMYYDDYVKIKDKSEIDLTLSNQGRSVINIDSGKIYRSVNKASIELNIDRHKLAKYLQGDSISDICGYNLMYKDEYDIKNRAKNNNLKDS